MKRRWVFVFVLALPLAGLGALWLLEPYLAPAAAVNVASEPVQLLAPGTVIEEGPPEGWTHLVLKTRPVLSSGAINKLAPKCRGYGTFLFMTTVARVAPRRSGLRTLHTLGAVALGMGTTVAGKDVVLSPETQAELGAGLDFIYRQIFKGAYKKQQEARMVARSPTFALLDTPCLLLRQGEHRYVIFRYALLVDRFTGRLDTLVWLIDREEENTVPEPIEWLRTAHVEQAPLHVDPPMLGGIPTPRSFAAERLPHGERQLPIPDELKELLDEERLSADEASRIGQGLRELMHASRQRDE